MPRKSELVSLLHPRYWLSWLGLFFLCLVALLPLPVGWAFGGVFGQLLYYLHAERRRITLVNIRLCFPEWDVRARRRLARQHFREFVRASLAVPIAWWGSRKRFQGMVRTQGWEHYEQALAQKRPVILLVPHFVGIEIGGVYLTSTGAAKIIDMYKKPKNRLFHYMMRSRRLRFDGQLVERAEGLKPVIKALKQGGVFYYLPDQDPGRVGTVFVPFFGVPTATLTALSRLASITNALVLPCYTRLLPYGQGYEVCFKPPLENFPGDDLVSDAARMNKEIEKTVREIPEQYLWVHKRFKTRPPGEQSVYKK